MAASDKNASMMDIKPEGFVINPFLFMTLSRQAMMAGFFVVVAVHFFTCYYLLSKNGLLPAIAFFVLFVNALVCAVFLIWDHTYKNRLFLIQNLSKSLTEKEFLKEITKDSEGKGFFKALKNNINSVLIACVCFASAGTSAALFILISLPYFKYLL